MSRHAPLFALCLLAGACSSRPPATLDQTLQGVGPAERKEILRTACLDEAEWPQRAGIPKGASTRWRAHSKHFVDPRVSEMKALCRRLDALTDRGDEKEPERDILLRECADIVRKKGQDHGAGFAEHAARTKQICEEMLGQGIASVK